MKLFPGSAGGEARVGPVIALPRVLEELGVSPSDAFRAAGVAPGLFDDPDNRIDQRALCTLLNVSATMTHRADFGLLVGGRCRLDDLGVLGELLGSAATLGVVLRTLMLFLHLHDRLAVPILLRLEPGAVFLGYSLNHPGVDDTAQQQDAAIAVMYRILGALGGTAWRPMRVQFSHQPPPNLATYRRLFRCPLQFDAEVAGIYFASAWLEHPITGADPVKFRTLNRAAQLSLAGAPVSFVEEVQWVLHQLLLGGSASIARVAQLFAVSERTLRERLRRRGASARQLLAETRFDLACHLLRNTRLPISEIAVSLCYADSAVFSRAFRHRVGQSPRQWRKENGGVDGAN